MNILLIEDNKLISKGLVYSFSQNGYQTTLCETCEQALLHSADHFDIMIIDVMLPDGNGFDLYKSLSRLNSAPAIFLTACDDEDSVVKGLELGADDYITKPFSTRELLARIKRLVQRKSSSNIVQIADITVDLDKMTVSKNSEPIELTALEYRIFSLLVQNIGNVVTRELILERIWDIAGNYVNDNTLTVYIRRIRNKLDVDIIKTAKGLGYKVEG